MAIEQNFTEEDMWFIGEDKTLEFIISDENDIPQNVASWDLRMDVRKTDKAPDPPTVSKTLASGISIGGVFNVDPAVNTQKITIVFTSSETDPLQAIAYRYALKRMTSGSEAILAFGDLTLRKAAVK